MSETNYCPECGAELPVDSLGGLCPKCLLAAGFESHVEANAAGSGQEAPTTPHSASFVPPDTAWLAAHFPQLEILELLGHGGMGAVYKARQPKLDRLVALKIIRPESADDPAFAERFNREARMLARLSHPHIVPVYDFGEVSLPESAADAGQRTLYFFLMEFVGGMNLRQLLQTGELLPQQALAIVPQICEALQFAHDEGVVHRDIKPENILLDKRGRVKIADFGLAKLAAGSPQDFTLTGTHQVMGTPRYMAPEQMEGSHAVDHRADIYSLGVVFYEMLTGEVPMGHFESPSKRVEIDVRLDEVVLRTLAREPERRYQHASDVGTDVNSIITQTGPVRPIEPVNVAWTYWKPSWQAYAAYSMVFALLLHSLVAAVYGNRFLWNNTVVLATFATILVTSCLAYLIEKLRFDVRISWRDPRNLLTLVLGFVMMLVTVLLPSPVELKDWLPSTTESLTERDERYLRILALGLSLWTFYFTAAHVWFALGWLIRRPRHIGPKSGEPKNDAKLRPRAVSSELEQTGASAVGNSGSAAEPYPGVLRLVQNPAWGLIITGVISWVTIPLAFAVPFTANMNAMNATQRVVFQISFGAIPLVVGTIMALTGFRMKRLEGYRLAMFAAVLPIAVLIFKLVGLSFGTLAIGPSDLVGAPVGLWVLVVLSRSDVKAAFHRSVAEQGVAPRTARGTLGQAWDEWWADRDRWLTWTVLAALLAVHIGCLAMFLALRGGGGYESGRASAWHHVGWPTPWFVYERGVEPNVAFRRTINLLSSSVLIAAIGMLAWYAFWRIQRVRDARNARFWRTIGSPTAVLILWILAGATFAWLGVRDAKRLYESMPAEKASGNLQRAPDIRNGDVATVYRPQFVTLSYVYQPAESLSFDGDRLVKGRVMLYPMEGGSYRPPARAHFNLAENFRVGSGGVLDASVPGIEIDSLHGKLYFGGSRGRFDHCTDLGRVDFDAVTNVDTDVLERIRADTEIHAGHTYIYESNIYEPTKRTKVTGFDVRYAKILVESINSASVPTRVILEPDPVRAGARLAVMYHPGSVDLHGARELKAYWATYDSNGKSLIEAGNSAPAAEFPSEPRGTEGGEFKLGRRRCRIENMTPHEKGFWKCELQIPSQARTLALVFLDELGRTSNKGIQMFPIQ